MQPDVCVCVLVEYNVRWRALAVRRVKSTTMKWIINENACNEKYVLTFIVQSFRVRLWQQNNTKHDRGDSDDDAHCTLCVDLFPSVLSLHLSAFSRNSQWREYMYAQHIACAKCSFVVIGMQRRLIAYSLVATLWSTFLSLSCSAKRYLSNHINRNTSTDDVRSTSLTHPNINEYESENI